MIIINPLSDFVYPLALSVRPHGGVELWRVNSDNAPASQLMQFFHSSVILYCTLCNVMDEIRCSILLL